VISGLLAGYGVAVPVGAIGVLIIGLSARGSLLIGAGAGLGTATADGLYALIAVAGGTAVAGLIRPEACSASPCSTRPRWSTSACWYWAGRRDRTGRW
jgi:hypothetical protein